MKNITANRINYRLPNNLTNFQRQLYIHLINWKWKHITKEPGIYQRRNNKGIVQTYKYDAILPDSVRANFPLMYPRILYDLMQHKNKYCFKFHEHFNHMASSQAANINLFLPVLLHSSANEILKHLKVDFNRLATEELYKGFRIEFWDGNSSHEKGILGDHSPIAGTDSDIAIAYFNQENELCLWLIEHKLTEKEFTVCGGAKSKRRRPIHDCSKTFTEILRDKNLCYYHSSSQYKYWNITDRTQSFFVNHKMFELCPFEGGLNQLWRNQLLGFALETEGNYKHVYFSVVKHPKNKALDTSIDCYKKLINNNPKFSVFDSSKIVQAAKLLNDIELNKWVEWYRNLYNI